MKFKASVKTSLIFRKKVYQYMSKDETYQTNFDYTEQFKELHNTLDHQLTIDETSELLMFYQKVLIELKKRLI